MAQRPILGYIASGKGFKAGVHIAISEMLGKIIGLIAMILSIIGLISFCLSYVPALNYAIKGDVAKPLKL